MTPADLVARREADWQRLAALVEGPARRPVTAAEAPALARLYRRTLADLAQLRTATAAASPRGEDTGPAVVWLNALVARAHARIHVAEPVGRGGLAAFFAEVFPRRFRAAWRRIALSAGVFAAAALVTYGLAAGDVGVARALAGPLLSRNAEAFAHVGEGREIASSAAMSSFYVTNNTQVAFFAFATGIAGAIGTLLVLVQNGLAIGLTLALVTHFGSTTGLLTFIAAHGPVELLAIFTAAGAGLGMGHALIAPGPFARRVALRRAAVEAVPLVMGAASLMVVAALFEAFLSPSTLSAPTKVAIGVANAAWLALYLTHAGREAPPPETGQAGAQSP